MRLAEDLLTRGGCSAAIGPGAGRADTPRHVGDSRRGLRRGQHAVTCWSDTRRCWQAPRSRRTIQDARGRPQASWLSSGAWMVGSNQRVYVWAIAKSQTGAVPVQLDEESGRRLGALGCLS